MSERKDYPGSEFFVLCASVAMGAVLGAMGGYAGGYLLSEGVELVTGTPEPQIALLTGLIGFFAGGIMGGKAAGRALQY